MTDISIKPGASLKLLKPQMAIMAQVVAGCYGALNEPCVITSGSDSTHGAKSLHYEGLALDFRTRDLSDVQRRVLLIRVQQALGNEFDCVLESDHLHCEWDVK